MIHEEVEIIKNNNKIRRVLKQDKEWTQYSQMLKMMQTLWNALFQAQFQDYAILVCVGSP